MDETAKQVCMITITMPMDDDDQAISMKKKIAEVISSVSEARIDFRLMNMPSRSGAGDVLPRR